MHIDTRTGPAVRRSFIGGALLLAACAPLPGSRFGRPADPGTLAELASGAHLPDTLSYHAFARSPGEQGERDLGTGRFETRVQVVDGREQLLQIHQIESSRGVFRDTVVAAVAGLAPISESTTFGAKRTQYRYDGARVERSTTTPEGADSSGAHRYDTPVFSFNQVAELVRAVPLREGHQVILPLYSQGDDALEMDTLTVLGPDTAKVWSVRFADRVITETYGIDPRTRKIVRYDVKVRKSGLAGRWIITRP